MAFNNVNAVAKEIRTLLKIFSKKKKKRDCHL